MLNEQTLIFTDLDGTLLDHFTYDFSPILPVLAQLKAKQIPVICNTSKTFSETIVLREQLALNTPFIVENGAAVYVPKGVFSSQPAGTIDSGDYWIKTFTRPRQHWLDLITKYKTEHSTSFVGFSEITHQQLVAITGLSLAQVALAKQREYSEPIQWVDKNESKTQFVAYLKQAGANVLQGGRFIHVSGHCNKGKAMNWLVKLYEQGCTLTSGSTQEPNQLSNKLSHELANELPKEAATKAKTATSKKVTTIALGDSYNDIAMLEAADVAILIRSPVHDYPKLKDQNKQILSQSLGPQGWADEIKKLLLTTKTKEVNHG